MFNSICNCLKGYFQDCNPWEKLSLDGMNKKYDDTRAEQRSETPSEPSEKPPKTTKKDPNSDWVQV